MRHVGVGWVVVGIGLAVACGGSSSDVEGDGDGGASSSSSGASTSSGGSSGTSGSTSSSGGVDDGGADGGVPPACAPKCNEGDGCTVDGDCATGACSTLTKKCVVAASCKGAHGGGGVETCGSTATPESCCRSLVLPTTKTRRLDRYEITAGRVRAFVEAVPSVRAFAKAHAAANPASQLASVVSTYAGLVDVLPDSKNPQDPVPLPVHLGAFPLDPINALDGCFVGPDAYGHATYWQEPATLTQFGVSARKYARDVLDAKPMNCVMPLFLAAFCAWDGGELARTSDYREVWGTKTAQIGAQTVEIPWAAVLDVGEFNWRNGHGTTCPLPWPGCTNPQPLFFSSPAANHVPAVDDSPAIGEPGRFTKDVTAATSGAAGGWFDVAGNLMEAAWPNGALNLGATPVTDVCDVTAAAGAGETPCTRRGNNGVRRYQGSLPHIALVGYSFEGHARRSENYLGSASGDEALIAAADAKPVTFQYGKVGGRCARKAP
jgi:hypothetical protein